MTRRRLTRALLWLVALALLVWAFSRVSFADAWRALRALDGIAVAALVGLNLFALVVFGVRFWVILRGLGHPIGLLRASLYRLAAFGFSYFTPGPQVGGEPVQVLLAERHDAVPREIAIASVGLDRAFDFIVNFGFLAAAALLLVEGNGAWFISVVVLVPVVYILVLARGYRPMSALIRHDIVRASEAQAGRFCRECPLHLVLALTATLASWAMLLGEYWMLLFFLGTRLSLGELVLGLAAARVAYMLLLPAGLGALEAGQVMALRSMGLDGALGLSVSLLIRLRDVIVASVGLWWGMRALTKPVRR